ncbi:MAG: energy-coupling factor transporter transmembrane component T [Melioribacteraceae bacterium]|nr:energy-coupling factor transporter transmembrane component T [Melioribacteraceae bacterium]
MLIDYYPSNSFIHSLDVRSKVLGFLVVTIMAFVFLSPVVNFFLAVMIFFILLSIKTPLSRIKQILKPLIPIFIIMLLITGFTYPAEKFQLDLNRKILFYLLPNQSLPFSTGGFFYGLTLTLRIFIMVLGSTVVTFSTPIEDIIQLMQKMKMPYQLAFVIATGIRFIPTMQKKSDMIQEAQKARGAQFGNKGFFGNIKSYIPVLIPMIVDSLRMSDNLAIAMLNRGFGAMKTTTNLHEIKMAKRDYAVCLIELLILTVAIWANAANLGVL